MVPARSGYPAVTLVSILLAVSSAHAQTQSGSIQGTVTDTSGAPLELVTVTISGPALQQPQAEFSDAGGHYAISGLPPGKYSVLFIYGDAKQLRENVDVGLGKATTVTGKIDTAAPDLIVITEVAPSIDSGSTKLGVTIDQKAMKNLPFQGRTFAAVTSSAAGSQADLFGESFSGSSSIENNYVVDGVNTTGLTFGGIGTPVLNNFIQEVEVITGGYNAEFGRSTGGVVNVVTKTGGNEFHGSLWANVTPFEAARDSVSVAGSAISRADSLGTNVDFGFDLGGPIVKDKLWFYVGFSPVITRTDVTRMTATRVDRKRNGFNYASATCKKNMDGTCDADDNPQTSGAPGCELTRSCEGDSRADVDPSTGFQLFEEIDRQQYVDTTTQYQFTGKLNYALNPDHQGQVSLTGTPSARDNILGVAGTTTANQQYLTNFTTDTSVKWTSKFFNGNTQVDAVLGWHRDKQNARSLNETLPGDPTQRSADLPASQIYLQDPTTANLGVLGRNRDVRESQSTLDFCSDDGPGDAFPSIVNCPVTQYNMNSIGAITDREENRYAAKATVTQRLRAAGHHTIKAGLDFELDQLYDRRNFTGGAFVQSYDDWEITRFIRLGGGNDVCGYEDNGNPRMCTYLDELPVNGKTFNWAGFVQDSWSILPNLTINAGLRYEQQRLGYSEQVQGTVDPVTMRPIGSEAVSLTNLIAPRVGVIYDWTKEGKSKIYGSWGRFFESIPMDINERSFGGEAQYAAFWDWHTQCGDPSSNPMDPALPSLPRGCPRGPSVDGSTTPAGELLLGANDPRYGIPAGVTLVVPGMQPQYLDELVLGVEYEVLPDLRVGVSYQNRRLGRVIEDLSTDGGRTFFIGNPGEFDEGEENALLDQIRGTPDSTLRDQLLNRLNLFRGLRRFDKPSRVYNALQLTAAKRFSKNFYAQASYTYSTLEGNFPGLFSPDTGQLDPNMSSQYDLYELLANRTGALPADRSHIFKLDAYYTFDLGTAGRVTTGGKIRAISGAPVNVLGRHAAYGQLETYVLPRGAGGRTGIQANADLHVAYARKLGPTDLELFIEIFNVFNTQNEAAVDNEYTTDAVAPIVGGDASDLPYLKREGMGDALARKKLNYGNTTAREAPLQGRIGATLSF